MVQNPDDQIAKVLADLSPEACRWVVQDASVGTMDRAVMCGQPRQDHSPYCSAHHQIAHGPRSAEQLAKDRAASNRAIKAGQRPGGVRFVGSHG